MGISIAEYQSLFAKKRKKFGNEPITTADGYFDSTGEYTRWCELKILERSGAIKNLLRQLSYQISSKTARVRPVIWRPDYFYIENGISVVEDFKNPHNAKNTAFRNKVKLFLIMYPDYLVKISTFEGVTEWK